jgi:hypothetical protein
MRDETHDFVKWKYTPVQGSLVVKMKSNFFWSKGVVDSCKYCSIRIWGGGVTGKRLRHSDPNYIASVRIRTTNWCRTWLKPPNDCGGNVEICVHLDSKCTSCLINRHVNISHSHKSHHRLLTPLFPSSSILWCEVLVEIMMVKLGMHKLNLRSVGVPRLKKSVNCYCLNI